MKKLLPWICALALAIGVGALALSNKTKDAELAVLREQSQQADALRNELEEARTQARLQTEQIAGLRKDTDELLRLRNQIRQLQDDRTQLARQAQTAKAEVDRVNAQAEQRAREQAQQAQNRDAQRDVCVNQMRQLEVAKQQWALERGRTPDSQPSPQELTTYLPNRQMPVCPAGGQYTFGTVSNPVACSAPGHVLQ